jgi:serine/threonine protein kinase
MSEYLDAFTRSWETDGPPALDRFLPLEPPEHRRLILVELVKIDIEHRLQRGLDRSLEDYLREFPELAETGPPADLLYEDYHLRLRAGLHPVPTDYFTRFPDRSTELARLLGGAVPSRSTSVIAARPPEGIGPGDTLDDFDLLAQLGEGQFARVFLARQRTMQRLVALKVSFFRGAEAQTLAQLDHPHIVRVFDQRVLADNNLLLVYMSYAPGGSLHDVLHRVRTIPAADRSGRTLLEAVDDLLDRRGETPPLTSLARQAWADRSWPATVCAIGAKLASALDYAHKHGVLHRDVKPANVLLTAEGEPLLVDFNVGACSKLEGVGPAGLFGGSLGYMSAEHLEAFNPAHPRPPEDLDGRADLFALAVTLWELTTGERPFGADRVGRNMQQTLAELAEQRRAGPSSSAIDAFPDADVPGFRDILLRCLDPDLARRPATAGELARELGLCLLPATRQLVRPARGGWREIVLRHPMATVLLIGMPPNALAALLNIVYNQTELIAHWPAAADMFERIIPIVNATFFFLGLLFFVFVEWPVFATLRKVRAGDSPAGETLARLRRRCLRMGTTGALVCVACWAAAGVVWPIALRLSTGPPPQGGGVYLHFLLSLVVSGLIAATFPYFLVTFLAVRVFYPALLGPDGLAPSDVAGLHRIERELSRYRAAATAVPFFAVALLAWRGVTNPIATVVLNVSGLLGVGLAFLIEGQMRAILAALVEIPRSDSR